jgi:hypothetical protein
MDIKHNEIEKQYPTNSIYLEDEYLARDIFRNGGARYLIKLNIGSPSQSFQVYLDTGSFITWVFVGDKKDGIDDKSDESIRKYDPSVSKYFSKSNERKKFRVNGTFLRIEGYVLDDVISLGDNPSQKTTKIVGANPPSFAVQGMIPFDGRIGLGRNYEHKESECNSDYSIIKSLFDQKLINKQVFSFKPINQDKGKFYLGDIHTDFSKDFAKCNIFNGQANMLWACRLSHTLIGDNITKDNFWSKANKHYEEFIIDSSQEFCNAPLTAYKYFEKNILGDLLASGKCEKKSNIFQDYITCSEDLKVDDLPPVYFVLNGYALKISAKYLFKNGSKFKGKLVFGIVFKKGLDNWVMGQPLFYENHILFDHEKNLIAFSGEYKDFTELTSDDDVLFSDYAVPFSLGVIGILLIIAVVAICRFRRKRFLEERRRYMIANLI